MKTYLTHFSPSLNRTAIATAFTLLLGMAALASLASVRAADLYVSANVAASIFKIAPDGTQTTFASVPTPRGLAFDSAGNLYVADTSNQRILKITPAGAQSTFASGLNVPISIALDSAGNLFVADTGANAIYKFTPAGAQSTFASSLNRPAALAFDKAGNLFESDGNSGSIFKFTPSGTQSTYATGLNAPAGLIFDSQGNLYEVDQNTLSVLKFALDGTRTTFAVLDSSVDFLPLRLAVDSADNIYLSVTPQAGGGTIYKYTPAGARSTFATETTQVSFMVFGSTGAPASTTAQLQNIATRLNVLTGDNVLIGGFIPTGTVPKKVVIRGIGPSLTAFGITNALADPVLELHGPDGATIATNDNWRSDANQAAQVQAAGLAPKNDLESALVATLDPNKGYTAIVSGKNGGTGVGLAEIYDIDPAAASKLGNIATRGFVDKGDNVMIGGLIVGPASASSTKVVVRGIGPSLTAAGVNGALQDPTLELHDSNGTTIASNDNWQTDANASQVQAAGLAPKDPRESAIYAVVAPAAYTAIVRGSNNTTGVGLVEVYNVQ